MGHDMSVEELEVGDETEPEPEPSDDLAGKTDLNVKGLDKESDAMKEQNTKHQIKDPSKDTDTLEKSEEVLDKLKTEENEASKVDAKIEVKVEDLKESKTVVNSEDDKLSIFDIKTVQLDGKGQDNYKENIEREIKTEKDVKEKDAKITIEYKNDASPIKDQKDIVKESMHEKLKTEHVEEIVGEKASKPTSYEGDQSESALNDNNLSEDNDLIENGNMEEDEVIIEEIEGDVSTEEETESSVNPGDINPESKLNHENNGLDREESSEEIRNVVKGLIETCIAIGPEDSKSTETCHEPSADIDNSCEESVTDQVDNDDLKST